MSEQFYTLLTSLGRAKIASSTALGTKLNITNFVLGDGNGNYYDPIETQQKLKNEVWRGVVNSIELDEQNPNWIVVSTLILSTEGGFTIREAGIVDADGDLIAIGKYPETYKPIVDEGSSKDLYIKLIIEVSNTSNVTLKVDPTVMIATKNDLDNHAEAKATISDLGHVKVGTGMEINSDGILSVADNIQQYKLTMADGTGVIDTTPEFNTFTKPGIYTIGGNSYNTATSPTGGSSFYGTLEVISRYNGTSLVQRATSIDNSGTWVRCLNGGSWTNWQSFAPGGFGLGVEATLANTDWNNYTKTGFYRGSNLANQPPAPTGANASNWWYVTVERHDTNYLIQVAKEYATATSYRRVYYNGTWGSWEQDGQQYALIKENGINLSITGTDFNQFVVPGVFSISGSNYTNGPGASSGLNGALWVIKSGTSVYNQVYFNNSNGKMWLRGYNGAAWSSWDQVTLGNTDFSIQTGSNGYQKLPSGLIIQWTVASIAGGTTGTQVNFPITFPTTIYNIQASIVDSGLGATTQSCWVTGSNTANCWIRTSYTTGHVNVIAIGY